MRILVLGYIVRGPLAGHTWHHLQYVLGLARLGHDVYFFEDSDDYDSCYDPTTHEMSSDPTFGLSYARDVFDRTGLRDRWAYYDAHTATWHGPAASRREQFFRTADVIVNVSGVNPMREWTMHAPVRILIDTDPAFTQVRHLNDRVAMESALRHNVFLSFAENIGRPECSIPDDGLPWKATRQPVLLDAWPVIGGPASGNFATMMQWQSYPAVRYADNTYGTKADSLPPYFDLPTKVREPLEIAIGGGSAPRDRLRDAGWIVSDPMGPSADPRLYQAFIRRCKAEFTIAKAAYVTTTSGWFSDRSAEFLASGRPVVTQETGFSRWLETKHGVLAFRSPEEAAEAIARVSEEYERHCRSARAVAEEYFDARRVLAAMLATAEPAHTLS